jgi:hypothetical protein
MGNINRRITVQAGPGIIARSYWKKLLKQKGLGMWLQWYSKALSSNPNTATTTTTKKRMI